MEFKHKEIIEIDTFYLETPECESFNKLKKESTSVEHLDNYYNWMCLVVGQYNQLHSSDVQVSISNLSDVYEHKVIDETFWYRASFTLAFSYKDCIYEHPKWYRNWFFDELNEIWKEHLQDECVYTTPPGEWLTLKSIGKAFSPFVHHINHQPI